MKLGGLRFSIQFLLVLHHGFANAKQFLWCKSNQQELENMKKRLNCVLITYIPFKHSLPLLTCRLLSGHIRNFCIWIKRIIEDQFDLGCDQRVAERLSSVCFFTFTQNLTHASHSNSCDDGFHTHLHEMSLTCIFEQFRHVPACLSFCLKPLCNTRLL